MSKTAEIVTQLGTDVVSLVLRIVSDKFDTEVERLQIISLVEDKLRKICLELGFVYTETCIDVNPSGEPVSATLLKGKLLHYSSNFLSIFLLHLEDWNSMGMDYDVYRLRSFLKVYKHQGVFNDSR